MFSTLEQITSSVSSVLQMDWHRLKIEVQQFGRNCITNYKLTKLTRKCSNFISIRWIELILLSSFLTMAMTMTMTNCKIILSQMRTSKFKSRWTILIYILISFSGTTKTNSIDGAHKNRKSMTKKKAKKKSFHFQWHFHFHISFNF